MDWRVPNAADPLAFHAAVWPHERLTPDQGRALQSVRDFDQVVIPASFGTGKSWLDARIVLWFLSAFYPAKVVTTAITNYHLDKILWKEIRQAFRSADRPFLPPAARCLETPNLPITPDAFAFGFSPAKSPKAAGDNAYSMPGHGFHAENFLFLIDEASGVEREIWNAARECATSGKSKIVATGNPIFATGPMVDAARSPEWACVRISVMDHPNILAPEGEPEPFPAMVSRRWLRAYLGGEQGVSFPIPEEEALAHERDHPGEILCFEGQFWQVNDLVRSRILGREPVEAGGYYIPRALVDEAMRRWQRHAERGWPRVIGADIAGGGRDRSVKAALEGKSIVRIETKHQGKAQWDERELMEYAEELATEANAQEATLVIDATGLGAGVAGRARQLSQFPVVSYVAAATPRDTERKRQRNSTEPPLYANCRAEAAGEVKRFLQAGGTLPARPGLAEELSAPTLGTGRYGEIILQPKEEVASILGRSPDEGDAVSMAIWGAAVEGEPRSLVRWI